MKTAKTTKKKPLKISLDFDEVLWDLKSSTRNFLLKEYNVDLNQVHEPFGFDYFVTNYPKIIDGLWNNVEEYSKGQFIEPSRLFVHKLIHEIGLENMQIVTASMPNVVDFKNQIIQRTFGDIKVIHTKDKFLYTKGHILIDDAIHNIEQHIIVNKDIGILFDHNYGYNWNKRPLEKEYKKCVRLTSYSDMFMFIRGLMK